MTKQNVSLRSFLFSKRGLQFSSISNLLKLEFKKKKRKKKKQIHFVCNDVTMSSYLEDRSISLFENGQVVDLFFRRHPIYRRAMIDRQPGKSVFPRAGESWRGGESTGLLHCNAAISQECATNLFSPSVREILALCPSLSWNILGRDKVTIHSQTKRTYCHCNHLATARVFFFFSRLDKQKKKERTK